MARPNVLFLMTDHTSAEAMAPGSPCVKPNLDRLAAEGTRFGRAYTTNAICSPARASLMTGVYPSTHGVWDCTHTQPAGWINVSSEAFPFFSQRLAEAGYQNGYFGKWHVEQSQRLERFGWKEHNTACATAPRRPSPANRVVVPKEGYPDYLIAGVDEETQDVRHPAFEKGIDFIRRAASDGGPFCCFISAAEPHDPYVPARRFLDLYDIDTVPLPATLRDTASDKPEVVRRMRSVWTGLTDRDWRRVRASYWATISFLDEEIGRVLAALRETGQYDSTIIVFTSDHGDMLGAHGIVAKGVGTPYEPVYNIPLIVRAPGAPRGVEDRRSVVSTVDVGPTLLDLCGADPLARAQGRSLRPVLSGQAAPDEWQDAYAEFYGQRFVYTQRIVWHGDWKYVFSPGGVDELYHLASDPHERVNLAADPSRRGVLIEMCKRMWRKMKAIGDESLFNTRYATLRTAPIGPLSI